MIAAGSISRYKGDMWALTKDEVEHFYRYKESVEGTKPMVLWGWKRDKVLDGVRLPESRTVYFSADLAEDRGQVTISRGFFFLESRAKDAEVQQLREQVSGAAVWADPDYPGYSRFRMRVGTPTEYDLDSIARRLKGKPRISIEPPKLVPEYQNYDLSHFAPFALCVGSGLSAESGLPLLGSIHNLFEVDNMESGQLIFGAADNLPKRMSTDPEGEFRRFCEFTIQAIKAKPSDSHKMLADLYKQGVVKQVFTDNMDDLLGKVHVPYIKTRLSIFPDRFPTEFHPEVKSLLVVGVAVDRRDVIKQARAKGLKIISINPVFGVAPHSRNMDYLARGDIFFRELTKDALPKIIEASHFGTSWTQNILLS
jgi:hypothetical protein